MKNQKILQTQRELDTLRYNFNTYKFQHDYRFSEYFDYSEFDSRDWPNSGTNIDSLLEEKITLFRNIYGKDFQINSGFRTHRRNAAVGGAKNSAHKQGLAVDIKITNSEDRFFAF
jgi:uncharacterized protein YcbK (DUF882 family)